MGKGTLKIKILGDSGPLDKTLSGTTKAIGAFGKAAVAGLAAAGGALVGVGKFAFDSAVQVDEAMDTIRIGTGATGDALAGLGDSFKTVFKGVPASAEDAGTAIADLNTRTGATGKALEELAKQSLLLSRITGEDLQNQIAATTRTFGDWSIAADDQSDALDYLFKVSQNTGVGVSDLSRKVTQFGAPLRQLGFDFKTSAALMGKWEKEGVNLETVLAGMKIGLANFSKEGLDTKDALIDITNRIKEAGSQAEANKMAIEVFGQRAGPDMAAAIREGRFELDDLLATLESSPETIEKAAEATYDFGEKWAMVKNKLMLVMEPLGTMLMDKLGVLADWVEDHMPKIEGAFKSFFDFVTGKSPTVGTAFEGIGSVLIGLRDIFTAAWPIILGVVKEFVEWLNGESGQKLISTLLDLVGQAAELVQSVFEAVWPVVQSAVQTFIDFLDSESGQALITFLLEGISSVLRAMETVFNAVWPVVQSVVQGFIDWFSGPDGQKVIQTLVGAIGIAIETVKVLWEAAWPIMETALKIAAPVIKATLYLITSAVEALVFVLDQALKLLDKLQNWSGRTPDGYKVGNTTIRLNKDVPSGSNYDVLRGGRYSGGGTFASGGLIPGSGPIPITAHGGEYVLTKGDTDLMKRLVAAVERGGTGGPNIFQISGNDGVAIGKEIVAALGGM